MLTTERILTDVLVPLFGCRTDDRVFHRFMLQAWADRESDCLFNIRRAALSRETFKSLTKCLVPLFGRLSEIVQLARDYYEVEREGIHCSVLLELEDGFSMAFSTDKPRSAWAGEVSTVVVEADGPQQLHDRWKIRFPEKLTVVMKDP